MGLNWILNKQTESACWLQRRLLPKQKTSKAPLDVAALSIPLLCLNAQFAFTLKWINAIDLISFTRSMLIILQESKEKAFSSLLKNNFELHICLSEVCPKFRGTLPRNWKCRGHICSIRERQFMFQVDIRKKEGLEDLTLTGYIFKKEGSSTFSNWRACANDC